MKSRRWIVVMGVALVSAGCPAEVETPARVEMAGEAPSTGVAFELAGPGGAALMVPVYVNGEGPFQFVLDTGATMTCVDRAVADGLDLPEDGGQTGVGMGVGEGPGALRLVRLDSLRVGEATARDLTGCTLDLEQFRAMGLEVQGLLGLNFLREFRLILDFETERLTLER